MLKHHLLLAFRNFKRNKSSSFINLIGLSTGLACALLIYLWVADELSVDKFHEKDKQLYQIMINQEAPDGIRTQEGTQGPLARILAQEMPEVEHSVAVIHPGIGGEESILSVGNTHNKSRRSIC